MNIAELKGILKGEVSEKEEDLLKASTDASIFTLRPQLVVRPENSEDVKRLVKFVAAAKPADPTLSITARSAGTCMSGGPLNDSIIMEMTPHFNKVIEVSDGFATAEPGVYYRDFEAETMKTNQLMPSYPASRELCTVGGMVANNAGGEKSLSYGKTEQYVRELSVVLSDGEEYSFHALSPEELQEKMKLDTFEGKVYREMYDLLERNYDLIHAAKPNVSKNSAGYFLWNVWDRKVFDLTKLFVGSQGTLGLVTKLTFRLVKKQQHSELVVMFLKDLKILGDLVDTITPYRPESLESYDDNTLKLAVKFFPQMLKRMKGNIFTLGWKFIPEAWMALTGGTPKLILIAEFTGATEEEIRAKMIGVEKVVRAKFGIRTHLTKNFKETQKYWTVRRESFSLLREHIRGRHTAPFIDDIVVRPNDLPEFLPRLNAILEPYRKYLLYTIAGHAGDGNFHIIPLMDFKNEEARNCIIEISNKVYSLVAEYKGSITGEHNDGFIRTPYLEQMYGPRIIELFRKTKDIFDPQRIFNPHKKVDGDIKYILQYMKKD